MMTKSIVASNAVGVFDDPWNFYDFDRESLEKLFATIHEPAFRARQLMQWIYHRRITNVENMTNLSLALRTRLKASISFDLPSIKSHQLSKDGTHKWLLELPDGNTIETVFIPENRRGTLCVSSQAGCALNCAFCATGLQGFSRNLSAAEIIGQVLLSQNALDSGSGSLRNITNVVMMGMGEPLLNYDAVVTAMRLMTDDLSLGLSRRRVTLSTAGLVPAIDRLSKECRVSLAVSLHATDDDLRNKLVPINRKYPIAKLIEACRRYSSRDIGGHVTFEYIMLDGINDSKKQALELCSLIGDISAKVNLIPFNEVQGTPYRRSSQNNIDAFRNVLLDADIMTITRKTRGIDIDAACGQLSGTAQRRPQSRTTIDPSDNVK